MSEQIELIEIKKIKPDPNQPRIEFDEKKIQELASTYKTQGMIHTIEIDENNTIILGERRWRAAKLIDLKKVKTTRKIGLDKATRLERQLIDDANRKDLSDMERAWAYATAIININSEAQGKKERYTILEVKKMKKDPLLKLVGVQEDLSKKSISYGSKNLSEKIGVPQATISYYISMLKTSTEVQKAVEDGELPGSYAAEIAKVKDPEQQQKVASIVLKKKKEDKPLTAKNIRKIVTVAKKGSSRLLDEISKSEPRISLDSAEAIADGLEVKKEQDAIMQKAIQLRLTNNEVDDTLEDIQRSREKGIEPILDIKVTSDIESWIKRKLVKPIEVIMLTSTKALNDLHKHEKDEMLKILHLFKDKITEMINHLSDEVVSDVDYEIIDS